MLEHARVYALIKFKLGYRSDMKYYLNKFKAIPYSYCTYDTLNNDSILWNVSLSHIFNEVWNIPTVAPMLHSIRVKTCKLFDELYESSESDEIISKFRTQQFEFDNPIESIQILTENEGNIRLSNDPQFVHRSIKFACDRGVSHELVRHRCAVAQSSTRYCNYSLEKFGNGDIAFVYPTAYDDWDIELRTLFEHSLKTAEDCYNYMISNDMTPQQARAVLPNALATEVVLTMPLEQWEHFFDLRLRGTTGAPHPDMKRVAEIAYDKFFQTL